MTLLNCNIRQWFTLIMPIPLLLFFPMGTDAQPTISFTFDDGITGDMPGFTFEEWNSMLLGHLDNAGIKSVFFVTGANKLDEKGRFLLNSWDSSGHKVGNHTFTHPNYGSATTTFEQFEQEFLITDTVINRLDNYTKLFRFPYLKEGDTKEKVIKFRELLENNGYRNGYVTIDASDWYINSRLLTRLRQNQSADIEAFKLYYLEHLFDRAVYYENLSLELTGRHINHTLLLHHNLAAALFLGDLIEMFRSKGWKVIDADKAFEDPVFRLKPLNIPAGESLVWALAKASGNFEHLLRYPAEDGAYEKARMDKLGL
jgi:peptidoglycan-N-acetylglucosamine deacetylase